MQTFILTVIVLLDPTKVLSTQVEIFFYDNAWSELFRWTCFTNEYELWLFINHAFRGHYDRFVQNCSHLLKKSLTENFIFVQCMLLAIWLLFYILKIDQIDGNMNFALIVLLLSDNRDQYNQTFLFFFFRIWKLTVISMTQNSGWVANEAGNRRWND